VFGTVPGEVAVDVVADSLRRSRIQVDVGVLAPDEPGRPRAVSQETTEVQGMNPLVTLSGYTGPRAACREGVRLRSGRYSLVTAGGP
jgi:hypothetical protein